MHNRINQINVESEVECIPIVDMETPALLCLRFDQFIKSTSPFKIESLVTKLVQKLHSFEYEANEAEQGAWRYSLPALSTFLQECDLGDDVLVFIEYLLPVTNERVDCLVLGNDGKQDVAIVFELKQWSPTGISQQPRSGLYNVSSKYSVRHPSEQADGYRTAIESHIDLGEIKPTVVQAYVLLHNWCDLNNSLLALDGKATEAMKRAPLIDANGSRRKSAIDSITALKLILPDCAERIIRPKVTFSRSLFLDLQDMLKGSFSFVLTDEQQTVYQHLIAFLHEAAQSAANGVKYHLVIEGGVGTGKSLLAFQLFKHWIDQNNTAFYMVGSKALVTNLIAKGQKISPFVGYFNLANKIFNKGHDPDKTIMIFDEAHRVKKPADFEVAMKAARFCVFFIDPRQVVLPSENGSSEMLLGIAEKLNKFNSEKKIEIKHLIYKRNLKIQVRCRGGNPYINWLAEVIYAEKQALSPHNWKSYEVAVFDTPNDLEHALLLKSMDNHSARMVAGYCWKWSDPNSSRSPSGRFKLVEDVKIGDWSAPWNEKPPEMYGLKQSLEDAEQHPYYLWATGAFTREVGCIYTAQGLEFDYVGVIIGPDLVWNAQQGAWEGYLQKSEDYTLKNGFGATNAPNPTEILKNIYWVLSTRGVKGTFFYSQDADTRAYLKTCLLAAVAPNCVVQ